MCKFHKDVAQKAATNPVTGTIDIGHETVIRVALSRYWVERYIDGADSVTGYSLYPMATKKQQAAFAASSIKKPMDIVEREEADGIALLQEKIRIIEQTQNLSAKALNLPITTAREAFTERVISKFYEGDPVGDFRLVEGVDEEALQPLYRAVAALQNDPEAEEVLARLVQGKICRLYTEAPQKVNMGIVEAYENLPEKVKDVSANLSKYGGNIVLGGFSGLVGHSVHYASVLGAGVMAGTASSLNLLLSGVFLAASYGGWSQIFGGKYRPGKEQLGAFAVQAGLTVAIAFGAQAILSHDNHGSVSGHEHHMSSEKAEWYNSLPQSLKDAMLESWRGVYQSLPEDLRGKVEQKALEEGIGPEVFMMTCSGTDPVSMEVTAYLTERANERRSFENVPVLAATGPV